MNSQGTGVPPSQKAASATAPIKPALHVRLSRAENVAAPGSVKSVFSFSDLRFAALRRQKLAMADSLEQALSKIRPHTSSSLPHQKAPAILLKALESTFREQNTEATATAYFAALLTTLDSTLQASRTSGPALGDGDVLPAELYLLALVTPFVPHPVIRSNLNTIISLSAPLFPALVPHAPPLRSQLTFYAAVFAALERSQLETPGLRNAFGSILHLCLDPRPKVRKRAAELVKDVLASPPPPMLSHPYADRTAEWVNASLSELTSGGLPKFKGKKADTDGSDTAIHLLAFLRPVLATLPSSVSNSKIARR